MLCPISNPENNKSVLLYREAISKAIPAICDGVEKLEKICNISAYKQLTEDPKMTPEESYQLIQVYSYIEGEGRESMGYELSHTIEFAQGFARKWVKMDPQKTPIQELRLLARTACYLELQEQKAV